MSFTIKRNNDPLSIATQFPGRFNHGPAPYPMLSVKESQPMNITLSRRFGFARRFSFSHFFFHFFFCCPKTQKIPSPSLFLLSAQRREKLPTARAPAKSSVCAQRAARKLPRVSSGLDSVGEARTTSFAEVFRAHRASDRVECPAGHDGVVPVASGGAASLGACASFQGCSLRSDTRSCAHRETRLDRARATTAIHSESESARGLLTVLQFYPASSVIRTVVCACVCVYVT